MKKFLLSILAIIYLGISTGVTLHIHYCMGKLVDIGLVSKSNNRCDKCGMVKVNNHKGCCHDEQKVVKIQQDQNNATTAIHQITQLSSVAVAVNYTDLPAVAVSSLPEENSCFDIPARRPGVAVYIRNYVIRL